MVEFAAGETSKTIVLTLVDNASREDDETFNLVVSNANGLQIESAIVPLTILDDDTVLDEFGAFYGLTVPERSIAADDDGDGLEFVLEYAFNLNPTKAELP